MCVLTTGHPTPRQCEASAEKLQNSRVHARLVGLRAPTAGLAPQLDSSLGQEGPLQKEMATHSSILAWKIPRTEGQEMLLDAHCVPA